MNHQQITRWVGYRISKTSHKTLACKRSYKGYYRYYISGEAYRPGSGMGPEAFSMHINSRNKQSIHRLCQYVARSLNENHVGEPIFDPNAVVVYCCHSTGA